MHVVLPWQEQQLAVADCARQVLWLKTAPRHVFVLWHLSHCLPSDPRCTSFFTWHE
jgi:hypothetical protein